MARRLDKELEQYRQLMTVPTTFSEGFSLSSFLGVLFVAFIMVPGALYMELLAGMGVGAAAQWVTVILFIEIAKRANAKLSRPQLFVLFYMCGSIVGQAVYGNLLWNQFLVRSDAAVAQGMSSMFPKWFAPSDLSAFDHRTFFQAAWLPALGLYLFRMFFGRLDNMVLSYGLFRLTSDIERLPFPLAPIGAQGIMALADDLEGKEKAEASWRWRVFSVGAALGLVFGAIYMGLPTITGAFFPGNTWTMFPIPFVDWTDLTKGYLPAVATGMMFDLGLIVIGMVMPYWAMVGSLIGLIATMVINPILYHKGILSTWSPGDGTVDTIFKNYIDLYFSFGIGLSAAVAVIGLMAIVRIRKDKAEAAEPVDERVLEGRKQRGDIPGKWVLVSYLTLTTCYILMCGWLIDWHRGVMIVLLFFGFLYTPMISYVTARLNGLAGQVVDIPFIRELAFILSGYKGLAVWFIPVSVSNYGAETTFYRQAELTGTRFWSLWKAEVFLFPIIILATIGFSSFIWSLAEIPSATYPFAQKMWELNAKNQLLLYASTTGEYSQFQEALSVVKIGLGFGIGMLVFGALSAISAPTTLLYGLIRGIGQTLPHSVVPQFAGAALGRFYFEKKLGLKWREYIPVLSAGYFCGAGLITMFCIGLVFLLKATNSLPY